MSDIVINGRRFQNADDIHAEWMKDPEYKAEYDALESEFLLIGTIIRARQEKKLTQAELAKKVGMHQSAISRLESGKSHPHYKTLNRVAKALDKKVAFV